MVGWLICFLVSFVVGLLVSFVGFSWLVGLLVSWLIFCFLLLFGWFVLLVGQLFVSQSGT